MVEWPCCYDPLRLSLGSYDLFFTNISPPLSLLPPKSLGLGSRRAAKPPSGLLGRGSALRETYPGSRKCTARKYPGSRKCSTELILGNGRRRRKISWGAEVQYRHFPGSRKPTAGKYPGARKCTTENILGHGSRLQETILGHGRRPRLASAALVAPSPARHWRALPCPSLISIHIPLSRERTFVLGVAKRLASSRPVSLSRGTVICSPRVSAV
jgi:hypothetical protein